MQKIKTEGMHLVDETGRERIFNGINIVDKTPYRFKRKSFNFDMRDKILKAMADKGINLIRLGFTWNKIEPEPGKYNDDYLESLGEIIDRCEKYGIYVFLDMHQDLYSPLCHGDGAPDWATLTDGYKPKRVWFVWSDVYFLSRACHRAFDNFWNNTSVCEKGLQEHYADCWKHIISKLGNKNGVIGFDFFNEPFPGTDGGKVFRSLVKQGTYEIITKEHSWKKELFKNLFSQNRTERILNQIKYELLRDITSAGDDIIEKFDNEKYYPFLCRMAKAAEEAGSDKIIFIENSYYSNTGIPFSTPNVSVNGKQPMQVFAPHAYDLMVDTPMYKYASSDRVFGIFEEHRRSQERLSVPVIVGEYGGFGPGKDEEWLSHISEILTLFDKNKWSSTYWAYMPGFLRHPLMKIFVRPHPYAVNGEIEKYGYDTEKKIFTLTFRSNRDGESEIFVPSVPKSINFDGYVMENTLSENEHIILIPSGEGNHSLRIEL